MPVIGPGIPKDDDRVEEAFCFLMEYLKEEYRIQKFDTSDSVMHALRCERNDNFKDALWKLFELESWESW